MPPQLIVVIVVAVLAMVVWSRLRLKQGLAENQDKTFGAVADRLGLTVEAGDRNQNLLYFQQPSGDYQRQLRASGTPYGHRTFFTIVDGVATSEYVVYRRITHSFGCYLEVELATEVPTFEAVLRSPNEYLVPTQSLADEPGLNEVAGDAKFVIRASDAAVGKTLAPALELLGQQTFVHLAARKNRLWIAFTRMGLPYLSYAAEEYLLALETAACALEGKPLPARVAA